MANRDIGSANAVKTEVTVTKKVEHHKFCLDTAEMCMNELKNSHSIKNRAYWLKRAGIWLEYAREALK